MSLQLTAWDNTQLHLAHTTPGDTTIERLGMTLQAFVTVTGSLLIPADMDPTSAWAVDALTGELANVTIAHDFISLAWDTDGAAVSYGGIHHDTNAEALYRWEVTGPDGLLVDLVHTPVQGWSIDLLYDELGRAGWTVAGGSREPFSDHPEHRAWTGSGQARVHPGRACRWLMPTTFTGPRRWPVEDRRFQHAIAACRHLGWAGVRVVAQHSNTLAGTAEADRAEAALVGVVERHLARPLFTDHIYCACADLRRHDPTSGHAAWCPSHEPALLRNAALRRLSCTPENRHA